MTILNHAVRIDRERLRARRAAALAVQAALAPAFRQVILEVWGPPTEAGRGLDVADVLDCLDSHDAHAGWADVAYEQYAADLRERLHDEDEHPYWSLSHAVAFAVQALCVLEQGVPTAEAVERLVRGALAVQAAA